MNDSDDSIARLHDLLSQKPRVDLIHLARSLSVHNCQRRTKDALIAEMLQYRYRAALEKLLSPSWWNRYHNHVYGAATVASLVFAAVSLLSSRAVQLDQPHPRSARHPPSAPQTLLEAEARIASTASSFSSTTLEEYYHQLYHASTTPLRRDQLQKDLLGKTIIWTEKVYTVKPGPVYQKDTIDVEVCPSGTSDDLLNAAYLTFDSSHRQELLSLVPGQTIRFTCKITQFVGMPFLDHCALLPVRP